MTPFFREDASASATTATAGVVLDQRCRSRVLRSIKEEGGFVFVSSVEKAATGDLEAAEAARDMAWEQLHAAPCTEVVTAWRDAYAMACLHVAALRVKSEEGKEALRALDLGFVIGGEGELRGNIVEAIRRIGVMLVKENGFGMANDCAGAARGNNLAGMTNDLEEMVQALPFRSLSCEVVPRQASLSVEKFLYDYFMLGSAVILCGSIHHWPACSKWKDINYLKRIAGDRIIPVEAGNKLNHDKRQNLITFSKFLEGIHSKNCPANLFYLSQHPLFDQIQELRNDIMIPEYCLSGSGELQSIDAWFGPAGTMTPLHSDQDHYLLAQVVGRNYVRLYSPTVKQDLYPYEETMLSNYSKVDLENFDAMKFPNALDLGFVDCILEEGEMLYIPPKWWHYVRSLSASFSVSFCWSADLHSH